MSQVDKNHNPFLPVHRPSLSQVDKNGPLGVAGVEKGDMLLEVEGERVGSFSSLKAALGKINDAGLGKAKILVLKKATGQPTDLTIFA